MSGSLEIKTREALEADERRRLAPGAAFADATKGRVSAIPLDFYRTEFQRDRDRIIHCKAFRRLSHKTQVFLAPEGDHYRTRLTHTLEVSQIARSIARALALNEDLTEAISLGHDLGHTPFGHTGEDSLDKALAALHAADPTSMPAGYRHNVQSLRIIDELEYEGKGLNLTWEVRDGIVGHTGPDVPATMEGRIVRIADRIAYVNHDIDDAVRAGVLCDDELPAAPLEVLGAYHGARITTMVNDMIVTSAQRGEIAMSEPVWDAMMELRAFLFKNVYFSARAKAEEPKASAVVKSLFEHYLANPMELPPDERPAEAGGLVQAVVDYVAGMTDRFAIREYERLFVPKKWLL
ncbi:MAG: deoxyguanosinetriphosphate triphosphohydrolase [Coriobacteriia bacterium]|nr:deoxyguanosinetriphosphate triphosphohydrolase [Coriobacteriia bacterium]